MILKGITRRCYCEKLWFKYEKQTTVLKCKKMCRTPKTVFSSTQQVPVHQYEHILSYPPKPHILLLYIPSLSFVFTSAPNPHS